MISANTIENTNQNGTTGVIDTNTSTAKANPIGINAIRVIEKRYAWKDEAGAATEDWGKIVKRVVSHVAKAERQDDKRREFTTQMSRIMNAREFIPNTPCLVNAGKPGGQLAACFVLPVEDSIAGIMEHAKNIAIIHQTGGGTGQSYEFLRPAGSAVNSTKGVASGPVSFMNIVNTSTDVVKQGGVRRGANMGILRVTHPDILRFIHAKNDQTTLTNFNISVTVTDKFMEAVENGEWFQLEFDGKAWDKPIYDPVTGKDYALFYTKEQVDRCQESGLQVWEFLGEDPVTFPDKAAFEAYLNSENREFHLLNRQDPPSAGLVYAPDIWNRIIASAHKYAEPGVIFIDEVNRHNLLKNSMGEIYSCNPCAEEMLHDMNACNLGSIDVSKFFKAGSGKHYSIDWEKLQEVVGWSIRFLDNVIDVCSWTLPEIEEVVKRTRPIGLGIMGFADLCLKLKIRYGSEDSLKLMDVLMRYIRRTAWNASLVLGIEKGAFPEFKANQALYKEFFEGDQMKPFRTPFPLLPRNYEVTTIAPTGTISLVAETSSGIEPNFSWAYHRRDTVGERFYVHPLAAEALGIEVDFSDEDSIKRAADYVARNQHLLPEYFVTAMDLTGEEHVRILAAAQRHVDNSISKTCNGKADDTVESVAKLYRLARELGCKAVSYYRDGSREGQVLTAIRKVTAKVETEATSETAVATTAVPTEAKKHVKTERPRELQGSTWVIDFDGRKLYVTVNHDGVKVLEVFASGFISNGVGILASTMLQSDCFSTAEVARKLDKITGTNSVWFNERLLTSPEQAVAECLRIVDRRLKNVPEGSRSSLKAVAAQAANSTHADNSPAGVEFKDCPQCREKAVLTVGGCPTCQSCGFSKCS